MKTTEQRACVRFCFKTWKSASETYELLQTAFGDKRLRPSNVWYYGPTDSRMAANQSKRTPLRPAFHFKHQREDIVKVRDLIRSDRSLHLRRWLMNWIWVSTRFSKFYEKIWTGDECSLNSFRNCYQSNRNNTDFKWPKNCVIGPGFIKQGNYRRRNMGLCCDPEARTQSSQRNCPTSTQFVSVYITDVCK